MKLGLLPLLKAEASLEFVKRDAADGELDRAAAAMERQFGLRFETLVLFKQEALRHLHAADMDVLADPRVTIVSESEPIVGRIVARMTEIANATLTDETRREFLDALLAIYGFFQLDERELTTSPDVIVAGIEREGRILAERLHLLTEAGLRPQAKRIHFENGLVVGISGVGDPKQASRYVIIDGAIASGATQITLLEHLRSVRAQFDIYSAHATTEGLRAICKYADSVGIDMTVTVGHATEGLNAHYYAVFPEAPEVVVVGDLGDTISPVS